MPLVPLCAGGIFLLAKHYLTGDSMRMTKNHFLTIKKKPQDLLQFERNSRTHSAEQITQICNSINEWGFTNPLIIDEKDMVIAGHGRLEAALQLGLATVPCIQVSGWSDTQKQAYVIADNKLALNAGWDEALLREELIAISEQDFNIELTGFDISDLLDEDALSSLEQDEEPEPPETPKSKDGDIWLLGKHRLMCGDSTDDATVAILMNGNLADMVFTDPPYNTGMTAQTQAGAGGTLWKGNKKPNEKTRLSHMFDDDYTDEEWEKFMADFCRLYDEHTKTDSISYICLDWRRSYELIPHIKNHFKLSNVIVWDKMVHGLGSDYKYTYELIHVCKKGKPTIKNKAGEKEYQDVWRIQRKMGRDEDHATKKPLELCERGIKHASKRGGIVLDLFGGSGSTLIAAEKLGRSCYMMELMPSYVDVTIKRWQSISGESAVNESTGKTFDDTVADETLN